MPYPASRYAYVNGRYVPHAGAHVHIEDRGFLFADGVYEVILINKGRLVDEAAHLERLERSLSALRIANPMSTAAMKMIFRRIIYVNGVDWGGLYIQITRGQASRDFAFPAAARPSLVITTLKIKPPSDKALREGVAVMTAPDIRWGRCDIKSVSLLAPVLAKQNAKDNGFYDVWMTDEKGYITEGSSNNAWIVKKSTLITRAPDHRILNGTTRVRLIELARKMGLKVEEKPFNLNDVKSAEEAFLSSTTIYLLPIVQVDKLTIGTGKPGAIAKKLRQAYSDFAEMP
jgi:D-alanine transaminase